MLLPLNDKSSLFSKSQYLFKPNYMLISSLDLWLV